MSWNMDGEKRKNNTSRGEVSFSPNLSTAADMFVHNLAEPAIQHPRPPLRLERNRTKEGELSVFGAEKYFNMMKPVKNDSPRLDDDEYSNKTTPRRLPWPGRGTPSASCEASWNSQTVLLRSFMKKQYENKKVDHGKRLFSNLSCSRSCSDGKSAYVNHRPINTDRKRLPQAKFQVKDELDSHSFNAELDDPRKSLEVFGSTAMKKRDIVNNLERKLSMFTWDAIPNAPTFSSITRSSSQVGGEIESDASSDLFEIDNISGTGTGQALFTRQASDGMSTSIEWSVVTASAAAETTIRAPGSKTAKILLNKAARRSRSGGILGCKNQKAVMVAETKYKRVEHPQSQQDSYKLTLR